ncbi:hypothetical protein HMPREF1883_01234 [Streptococcus agalactiae]|nr:hypothetical protein HMPREF1883_01234 [Streptococcus agalactiae]
MLLEKFSYESDYFYDYADNHKFISQRELFFLLSFSTSHSSVSFPLDLVNSLTMI